jgi:hypothetical protein
MNSTEVKLNGGGATARAAGGARQAAKPATAAIALGRMIIVSLFDVVGDDAIIRAACPGCSAALR